MSASRGWLPFCFATLFPVSFAPLSGQGQSPKPLPHSTAVVRPLSLGTNSTPQLKAVADTTRAHIVLGLKAAGVTILDRSLQPVRANDLTNLVTAHFAIVGVAGMVDTQFIMIVRLATMDGDSLRQVRLLGPLASAATFGDSLARLFAPTILGRPLAEP
jgi:hypothetical protein